MAQHSRVQFVRKVTHFVSQVEELLLELGERVVELRCVRRKPSLDVTQRDGKRRELLVDAVVKLAGDTGDRSAS
jgi:hypothetical protein